MKHVCSPSADLSRTALWEGGNRAHELANQPNLEEYQLVWLEICDFMRMRVCTGDAMTTSSSCVTSPPLLLQTDQLQVKCQLL